MSIIFIINIIIAIFFHLIALYSKQLRMYLLFSCNSNLHFLFFILLFYQRTIHSSYFYSLSLFHFSMFLSLSELTECSFSNNFITFFRLNTSTINFAFNRCVCKHLYLLNQTPTKWRQIYIIFTTCFRILSVILYVYYI